MRWVRGKLRGPCAFLVHRSGQEQIDGPASIADDFNHNDGPQASASTTEITKAVPRPARIAFYTVLAGKEGGIAGHRVMKSRLRPATISPPRAGPRPLAETVQPLPKEQESHRDSAPIRGLKTRTKAYSGTSARQ